MHVPFSVSKTTVEEYLSRASFTFNNAVRPDQDPRIKTFLIAFCLHSCQSTAEALALLSEERADPEFTDKVSALPHLKLIGDVRNLDLHGRPIPVCTLGVDSQMIISGLSPMEISSSHGVGVSVQFDRGGKPRVRHTPKDMKRGKFTPGDAVTFVCQDGELYVFDKETKQTYLLLGVLREFIQASQALVGE